MKRKAALGTGILTMVLCLAMGFYRVRPGVGAGWKRLVVFDGQRLSEQRILPDRRKMVLFRRRRLHVHRLGAGWRKVVLHGRFRRDAGQYHYAGR